MDKHLQKLCNSGDYDELYRALEQRTCKVPQSHKKSNLANRDYEELKNFAYKATLALVYQDKSVPTSLLRISEILGTDHLLKIRYFVCNYIISQKMADISQFISAKFQNIGSLQHIYDFVEKKIEESAIKYENLPQEWNIDLKILNRSLVMIKQALCSYFYNNDVEKATFSLGFLSSVKFEQKLIQFYETKQCCLSKDTSEDSEIQIHGTGHSLKCIHKNMISSVFIPYLDLFVEKYLELGSSEKNDSSITTKYVLPEFTTFFEQLEFVYDKVLYLNDRNAFLCLFEISDQALLRKMQEINLEDNLNKGIMIISTLMYIEEIMEEYICKMSEYIHVDLKSLGLEAARKLEKSQSLKIERCLGSSMPAIQTEASNFNELKLFFESFLSSEKCNTQELKEFLLEIGISLLFSRVTTVKMNSSISELLFKDILSLEEWLRTKFSFIPHIKTMKEYLKIFTCPLEPREEFVKNFKALSNEKFNFDQILRAIKDQKAAQELYMIYRKLETN